MHGEISRRPFGDREERKHYAGVNMQMGRVQLDSDWNEQSELLLQARARALADVIGRHGSPNDGFRVATDLILDHMESREGWSFTVDGAGTWAVDHLEMREGKGCFTVSGSGTLGRRAPKLLQSLLSLRQILVARGIAASRNPRLLLHYRVSAAAAAKIWLTVAKAGGLVLGGTPDQTYPCNGWQVLALDLAPENFSEIETLSIQVATAGIVYLDWLAVDPGLLADTGPLDFYIQGGDGESDDAGRYYVDGLAAIMEGFATYLSQEDYPEPPAINVGGSGTALVYLDLWRRTITAVEDPEIREVALGGPDTCTREKLVAQVKVLGASGCGQDIGPRVRPVPSGTLTANLAPKTEQAECDFRPELDYTGLDNSLYRVEIHVGGAATATVFKWSRNNGADLVPVTAFDPDTVSVVVPDDRLLCCGDWVELADDVSDLADFNNTAKHGKLATIVDMTDVTDGVKIKLDFRYPALSTTAPFASRVDAGGKPVRHPKLRKWHGVEAVKDYTGLDPDGTPKTQLEHGIRLAFSSGQFFPGDYWQFAARVLTRAIEELDEAPPVGPVHHYAPLGDLSVEAGKAVLAGCRLVFSPLTRLEATDVRFQPDACTWWSSLGVENVQQALDLLCRSGWCADQIVFPGQSIQDAIERLGPEGGTVWLAAGIHLAQETIHLREVQNVIIRGDGPATRLVYLPSETQIDVEAVQNLKEEIAALEEKIKTAEESGNAGEAKELRAQRRDRLGKLYAALGLSQGEIDLLGKIDEVKDQLEEAKDEEELGKLEEQLHGLQVNLAELHGEELPDLFRIEGAHTVSLERFLMLSWEAESLVAVVKGSKGITVSGCDLLNLAATGSQGLHPANPVNVRVNAARMDMKWVLYERLKGFSTVESLGKAGGVAGLIASGREKEISACIRLTECCEVTICDNRMVGKMGILQQGGAEIEKPPVVEGLRCRKNRLHMDQAGILLVEGEGVRIEENAILPLGLGLDEEELKLLKELLSMEIPADDPCLAKVEDEVNELIDGLIELVFGCMPDLDSSGPVSDLQGILACFLRSSEILENTVAGIGGIGLVFSQGNVVAGNRILADRAALRLIYSRTTGVTGNSLAMRRRRFIDTPEMEKPATEATGAAKPETGTMNRLTASMDTTGAAKTSVGGIAEMRVKGGVIEVHFCDRTTFEKNEISGGVGWLSIPLTEKEFVGVLTTFAGLWDPLLESDGAVLLAKRFSGLMGLGPSVHLIETILKLFAAGKEVDWIAFLVEGWSQKELYQKGASLAAGKTGLVTLPPALQKNPFVVLLVKLFALLIGMQLVSRSAISGNRIDVTLVGIQMEEGVTLGGVRILENRSAGASQTAILWRALPLLNNPELTGLLLACLYEVILFGLIRIRGFLKRILEALEADEGQGEASPILVFVAMATLYGVGQVCPEGGDVADGETGTTAPENPFVKAIKELIDALDALIDQLQDDGVKRSVSDLASSDHRLSTNQIRGAGTGIVTNIATAVVAANRIDVEPGESAVAELFAIGRLLAAHAELQAAIQVMEGGAGQATAHPAVEFLGQALMNLNPEELAFAGEMLGKAPLQWKGLETALEGIKSIAPADPKGLATLNEINEKTETLRAAVAQTQPDENAVTAASTALVSSFAKNLTGYGMILEAPSMEVADNRVEAVAECDLERAGRRAPGGILVTGGRDPREFLTYLVLLEEIWPLANIGGQRTSISGNSLQWGTGHGLSLSFLPLLFDMRIEENEIQNHGLGGIWCDRPILVPTAAIKGTYAKKADFKAAMEVGDFASLLPSLVAAFSVLYRVTLEGNEINQCFLNPFAAPPSGEPPSFSTNLGALTIKIAYPTLLGGMVVKNAMEVNCSGNTIRACLNGAKAWTGYGSLFRDCRDVTFERNLIVNNGRNESNDLFYPRGGAAFLGGAGGLTISGNELRDNEGVTLLVTAGYSLIVTMTYKTGTMDITVTAPAYDKSWSLERLLVCGNTCALEGSATAWAKIQLGEASLPGAVQDVNFSQNYITVPAGSGTWQSVSVAAHRIIFHGNMAMGQANLHGVSLAAEVGVATGNALHVPLTLPTGMTGGYNIP